MVFCFFSYDFNVFTDFIGNCLDVLKIRTRQLASLICVRFFKHVCRFQYVY